MDGSGHVVGESGDAAGHVHAVVWENGVVRSLGTLGGTDSKALAISREGVIAGEAQTDAGSVHAFRYALKKEDDEEAGPAKMIDLGTLGGKNSKARAINMLGEVVGEAQTQDGTTHAFVFVDDNENNEVDKDEVKDLGTLGGKNSRAYALIDSRTVVGESETADANVHAFLFAEARGRQEEGKGGLVDLGTLGGKNSRATGISAFGRIVGWAETDKTDDKGNPVRHAFLFSAPFGVTDEAKMIDLNTLLPKDSGWELLEATAINAWGQIVGQGRFKGTSAVFLLTPHFAGGPVAAVVSVENMKGGDPDPFNPIRVLIKDPSLTEANISKEKISFMGTTFGLKIIDGQPQMDRPFIFIAKDCVVKLPNVVNLIKQPEPLEVKYKDVSRKLFGAYVSNE